MPYVPVTYNTGSGPGLDGPAFNTIETQFQEAILSLNPDLYTAFVLSGMVCTKDGTTLSQLDVTSGTAYLKQTDQNELRQRKTTATTFSASGHPSATLFLDLNSDGTWSWGTAHSADANHLTVATVTTDGSSNIATVTDTRTLSPSLFSGMTGHVNLPNGSTANGSKIWTAGNDGAGSGLDADTLDGHDSTYFAPAGNYVNKAGDTMTGALTAPAFHGPADSANSVDAANVNPGTLPNGTSVNYAVGVGFAVTEGSNGLVMGRNSGDAAVRIANRGTGGVGFATGGMGGQRLAEAKSNGDFIIHGTTYWTDNPSAGFNNSGSYENFDVCEEYPTDRADYAPGAVLCPHGDVYARCTHDNCHAAAIVSAGGAFHIGGGQFEDDETPDAPHLSHRPLALAGRVLADTQDGSIAPRDLVCADGMGGVRRVLPGEHAFTIGYALTAAHGPQPGKVGVFVRPLWCIAP